MNFEKTFSYRKIMENKKVSQVDLLRSMFNGSPQMGSWVFLLPLLMILRKTCIYFSKQIKKFLNLYEKIKWTFYCDDFLGKKKSDIEH